MDSLGFALLGTILMIWTFVFAGVGSSESPEIAPAREVITGVAVDAEERDRPLESQREFDIGMGAFGAVGASLLAFVCGIAAYFQRTRRRTFAHLGIAIAALNVILLAVAVNVGSAP